MKENDYVAETRDWTRDIQILSVTLSQLSYFALPPLATKEIE